MSDTGPLAGDGSVLSEIPINKFNNAMRHAAETLTHTANDFLRNCQ